MDPRPENRKARKWITGITLISLTGFALYFCFVIARPFLTSIAWSLIISVTFHPIHARIRRVICNRSATALVSIVIVILILIVPAMLLGLATISELRNAFQTLSEKSAAEGGWTPYLTRMGDSASWWIGDQFGAPNFDLKRELVSRLDQIDSLAGQLATSFVGNVTSFLFQSVLTLFILFFMLRDGPHGAPLAGSGDTAQSRSG